jgi:hypothetical protein
LVHWEIVAYRTIDKLTIHEGVFGDFASVIFAVEISGTIDVRNGTAGSRRTPDEHIGGG